MTDLARRLRGALGIGVTWGVLWVGIGLVLSLIFGIVRLQDIGPGEGPGKFATVFGLVGFLSGLGFAGLLYLAERRRTIQELSLGRVALWGLLGSAAIPLLLGADPSMGLFTGPIGAIFATTTVAAARRKAIQGVRGAGSSPTAAHPPRFVSSRARPRPPAW